MLQAPAKTANGNWFVIPKPNPQAKLRLFCFPYSGGGGFAFHTWANHLPTQVELCAVQLPGRENRLREPLCTALPQLVEQLMGCLPALLDRPYALFGHSLGAVVAFEVARTLRREHNSIPVHLFASARPAPQCPNREAPMYCRSDAELFDALRQFNGTEEAVLSNAELMKIILPILRADLQVNETYQYRPEAPLDCPITALRGAQDPDMSQADAAAWGAQTTRAFTLRTLPGGHFFVHTARNLLWQLLTYDLALAMERLPVPR